MSTNLRDGNRVSPKSAIPKTGTVATSGDNELIAAPGENMRIVLLSWSWWNETITETSVLLKSTTLNIDTYISAISGGGKIFNVPTGFKVDLPENEPLILNLDGAMSHGYFILYYEEEVIW